MISNATPLAVVALATAMLGFCSSMDVRDRMVPDGARDAGGAGVDADAGAPGSDAGALDAGPADVDASGDTPDASMPSAAEGESDADFLGAGSRGDAVAACYDGDDNDGDGTFDCADVSCQTHVGSCCVGMSSSTCCAPGPSPSLEIARCDGDLTLCAEAAGLSFFGASNPTVAVRATGEAPTLIVTDDQTDVGLAMPERFDPRAGELTLRAQIAVPTEVPPGIDAIGFALIDAAVEPSTIVSVAPVAGVMVSRNRQRLTLVLADESVMSWDAPADGAFHEYALTLRPDGAVLLTVGDPDAPLVEQSATIAWSGALRAVVYGRVTNPTASGPPTRMRSFAVSTTACDMPAALGRSPLPAVPAPSSTPGWASRLAVSSPSVLTFEDGATTRMALDVAGDIYLAEPRADGFHLLSAIEMPAMAEVDRDWGRGGVGHPALFHRATSGLELFFTAYDDARIGTIARVAEQGRDAFDRDNPTVVLSPATVDGVASFDQAAPFELAGALHVAVQEKRDDGSSAITVWDVSSETAARVATVRGTQSGDLFAFDRDEVGAPFVYLANDVYRLYYAGRRGTRWSIGLMISDDGRVWHESAGPVLGPSGVSYDALSVTDPSVASLDGELRLYYTGSDGRSTRIGWAAGALPPAR